MDGNTIIKRITIEPAGPEFGEYRTSIMTVETADGTERRAVSAGNGPPGTLTLREMMLPLERHIDFLKNLAALPTDTTLRAKGVNIVAIWDDLSKDELHFTGEIHMEDGTVFKKGVTIGGAARQKVGRTQSQLMEIARKRVQDFANRLTLDSQTRCWMLDGDELR